MARTMCVASATSIANRGSQKNNGPLPRAVCFVSGPYDVAPDAGGWDNKEPLTCEDALEKSREKILIGPLEMLLAKTISFFVIG